MSNLRTQARTKVQADGEGRLSTRRGVELVRTVCAVLSALFMVCLLEALGFLMLDLRNLSFRNLGSFDSSSIFRESDWGTEAGHRHTVKEVTQEVTGAARGFLCVHQRFKLGSQS